MSDQPPSADMQLFYREDLDQRGVRATRPFVAGELVMTFGALRWHAEPNRMTMQESAHRHFELDPPLLESINHGCDPNMHFDVDTFELRALRDVAPGEELTAFYPSSEWDMRSPFTCCCGAVGCHGQIRGAKHLPATAMARYRTSAYVSAQLAQAAGAVSTEPAVAPSEGGIALHAFSTVQGVELASAAAR